MEANVRLNGKALALFVECLVALMLLDQPLQAQSPAWLIGNEVLVQPTSGAPQLSLLQLPEPNDPNEDPDLQYQGQLAEYSQFVEMDDLGRIQFFIIDGRLYDKDGYLVADVNGGGAAAELFKGITEVVVYPVPGRCGLWYVFSSESGTLLAPYDLEYSVLDLTVDNPLFSDPERRGTLLDISDAEQIGFNPLSNWEPNLPSGFSLNPDPFTTIPVNTWQGTTGALHFDAVYNAAEDRHFLFASTGWHFAIFEITSDDLVHIMTSEVAGGQIDFGLRSAKGELEVVSVGSEIHFAFTNYHAVGSDRFFTVLYRAIDATEQDLLPFLGATTYTVFTDNQGPDPLDINGDPIVEMRIGGLEFSPNGEYLYWWMPHYTNGPSALGYIDLDNNSLNDLVTTAPEFFDSELELGMAPGGTTPALYVCGKDALGNALLGALIDPDDPVNAVWDDDVFALNEVCLSGEMNGGDLYYLLNAQPGGNPPPALTDVSCCATRFDLTAYNGLEAPSGSHTWNAASNPFGTSNTVRVTGTLLVPSGASLTIQNMRFEFGPDAGVVVEPGGYLYCNGCTLTNACGERWKGVEVRGSSTLAQVPYSNQGRFRTQNAVVENAEVGALVAERNGNGGWEPTGYRGIVQSTGTTWKNNIVDVHIPKSTVVNNQTRFVDCDFISDQDWPDAAVPHAHAWLRDCGIIRFQECRWSNNNTPFEPAARGFGILSTGNAAPRVLGNGDPQESYMEGLWCGVAIGKHRNYWVRDMNLRGNTYGIVDFGPILGEVTGNVFDIPEWDQSTPAPVGVLLYQTSYYVVEENILQSTAINANSGIVFWGPVETTNRIYNNTFQNLSLGTFVIGDHQDEALAAVLGLDILCGDYTDNRVDYGMGPGSYISDVQGIQGNPLMLAGNRFFNTPDCSSNFDMAFGPGIPGDSYFDYHRHDDADCDVICEDFYMSDVPMINETFEKIEDCAAGYAAEGGGINIVSETSTRKNAKAALLSSLAQYHETVDLGETPEVMEAIEQDDPLLASYVLRDILLAHHPLSDAALEAVLDRLEPMDGWHITQVFMQNAPVQSNIFDRLLLSGLVSAYQIALLEDAQANGPGSMKDVLEEEIHETAREHHVAYTNCLRYWSLDTVSAGAADSLEALLLQGTGTAGRLMVVHQRAEEANYGAAQDSLLADWAQHANYADMLAYVNLMEATGNGDAGGPTEFGELETIALAGNAGAGLAWDVLLTQDHWRYLPEVEMPNEWKAYRPAARPRQRTAAQPMLQAQPNPATDQLWLSYGTELKADELVVHGAQGQVVWQQRVGDQSGVIELDLKGWSNGLYLATLFREGIPVGETKFTVTGAQ